MTDWKYLVLKGRNKQIFLQQQRQDFWELRGNAQRWGHGKYSK